jgi:hypothetical protein
VYGTRIRQTPPLGRKKGGRMRLYKIEEPKYRYTFTLNNKDKELILALKREANKEKRTLRSLIRWILSQWVEGKEL